MADISKVTIDGVTYNLKDEQARESIINILNASTGAMKFLGKCLNDENITGDDQYVVAYVKTSDSKVFGYYYGIQPTQTTYSYGGNTYTIEYVLLKAGNVVISGLREYVFSEADGKWHEFGSTGSIKSLAFKDTASGTIKPKGNVLSTFSGSAATLEHTVVSSGTVTASGSYTPSGSVTQGTKTTDTVVKSYPGVSNKLDVVTIHDTPTSQKSTFTKKDVISSVTAQTNKLVKTSIKPVSGSTTASKASATAINGLVASVANEILSLTKESVSFTNVTVPIEAAAVSVATGTISASGTGSNIVSGITTATDQVLNGLTNESTEVVTGLTAGTEVSVAKGTVSTSGTGASVLTGLGTPVTSAVIKTIGNPTFTGTQGAVSVSGSNSGITIADHSYTPNGSVSSSFTGTEETITVS